MKTEFTSRNGALKLTLKPDSNNERAMLDAMALKERMMRVIKPRFAVTPIFDKNGGVESISIKNERFINRRVLNAYGFISFAKKCFIKKSPNQKSVYLVWGRGSYHVWEVFSFDFPFGFDFDLNNFFYFIKFNNAQFIRIKNSDDIYMDFYFSDSKIINTVADLEQLVSRQPKKK